MSLVKAQKSPSGFQSEGLNSGRGIISTKPTGLLELVSCELFQAQGMTGVARWNYQRLLDLKRPDVILPPVFDALLISELNCASKRVTGKVKNLSDRDMGERFGLEYREPECRPVPLDWNKHRVQRKDATSVLVPLPPGPTPYTSLAPPTAVPVSQSLQHQSDEIPKLQMLSQRSMDPPAKMGKLIPIFTTIFNYYCLKTFCTQHQVNKYE